MDVVVLAVPKFTSLDKCMYTKLYAVVDNVIMGH